MAVKYRDPTPVTDNDKSSILNIAKGVREKMYGVDVRELIASGFETISASKSVFASMFKGKLTVDYINKRISLNDYDFVLQDMQIHPTKSDSFTDKISIPEFRDGFLYLLVLKDDGNLNVTGISIEPFDKYNASDYILGIMVNETFYAPYIGPELVEVITKKKMYQDVKELVIGNPNAVLVDKKSKKITVINKNLTLFDPTDNPRNTYFVDQGTVVDFAKQAESNHVLALVYNFSSKKLGVKDFMDVTNEDGLIAYFRPLDPLLNSSSDKNCFKIVEVNGEKYYPEVNRNKLGSFSDKGNVVIDFQFKKVTFKDKSKQTITTLDYGQVEHPELSDINFSGNDIKSYWIYVLCKTADNKIALYPYNNIPEGAWLLANFKPDGTTYHIYGNQEPFIVIDTEGQQIYPILKTTYNIPLPKFVAETNGDLRFDQVGFTGRWAKAGSDYLYTTNLGSKLYTRVHSATQATAVFDQTVTDDNKQQIAYRIDGGAYSHVVVDGKPITIDLPDKGYHYITLVTGGNKDADNVWDGGKDFRFRSLTLDSGTKTPVTVPKKIAFVGDSITAGCWVNGKTPATDYRAETTYSAIAAQLLQADDVRIAYSRAGVERTGEGNVPNANGFITNIDSKTEATPSDVDAVVVNLGTNDDKTSTTWNDNYNKLLDKISVLFAGAKIILMIPFGQQFADSIRKIGADRNLLVVETADWALSYTDGTHPDQKGHNKAGKLLAQELVDYI